MSYLEINGDSAIVLIVGIAGLWLLAIAAWGWWDDHKRRADDEAYDEVMQRLRELAERWEAERWKEEHPL